MTDQDWLLQALHEAHRCPHRADLFSVGAVVVDGNGTELARGYSREVDDVVHAEESALNKIADRWPLPDATIYSTLEPCGERKSRPKTCAELIIASGIRRVVFAWREPATLIENPKGVAVLLDAGVEVIEHPEIGTPFFGWGPDVDDELDRLDSG